MTVRKHVKPWALRSTCVPGCSSPAPRWPRCPSTQGLWRPLWSSARHPAGQALGGSWRGRSWPGSCVQLVLTCPAGGQLSAKARGRRGHVPGITPRAGSGVSTRGQGASRVQTLSTPPPAPRQLLLQWPLRVTQPSLEERNGARSGAFLCSTHDTHQQEDRHRQPLPTPRVTASLRPHFGQAVLLSGCQPWPLEGPRTSVHLAKSGVLAEAVVQAGSRWDPGT